MNEKSTSRQGTETMMRNGKSAAWIAAAVSCAVMLAGCGERSFFEAESADDAPVVEASSEETERGADEGADGDSRTSSDESRAGEVPRTRVPPTPASTENGVPEVELAPIRSWLENNDEVAVENRLDRRVPLVAHVYVHSGGVLLGRVRDAGEETDDLPGLEPRSRGRFERDRFVPAPKEDPVVVERQFEEELVAHGYDRAEAERIVAEKGWELFGEHGARAVYIAPPGWVEGAERRRPLGAVTAPPPTWRR